MTNREKRLAKDMYRNFVGRYERGTLRANDLYEQIIMQTIEIERMAVKLDRLELELGIRREDERIVLHLMEKDEETIGKLFEVINVLTKGELEKLKHG